MLANIISGLALALSVLTYAVTQIQRTTDTRRVVRQQLTDVLGKIADWRVKGYESPGSQEYLGPVIAAQARLAASLIDQLPKRLVTDTDYVSLASAAEDPIDGRRYYDQAVMAARSPFYRRLARRGYASYLFSFGDYPAARKQVELALGDIPESGDEGHALRYDLYSLWAGFEDHGPQPDQAEQPRARANAEFSQIQNPAWRHFYSQGNGSASPPSAPESGG